MAENINDFCDLDPTKLCDNCCKCIERDAGEGESGFRVLEAAFETEERLDEPSLLHNGQLSSVAALFDDAEDCDAFEDELEPLDIPPELMAEWEAKLRESFLNDRETNVETLRAHGVRKIRG